MSIFKKIQADISCNFPKISGFIWDMNWYVREVKFQENWPRKISTTEHTDNQ